MKQLNLSSFQDLDGGKVALAFTHALKQCVADIEDRPMVRDACPSRRDLISPGSGKASIVRDANGQIVAFRDFDG